MKKNLSPMVVALLNDAHILSEGTDNAEYVRGQAELIAQYVPNGGDVDVYHENIEMISKMITERR